jgi:hypothetical protein
MSTVDAFRQGLDDETRATVDALRAAITAACPTLVERLKWNAPSFALASAGDDDDCLTLGLERKGGVRVVLHRGAKVKDTTGFVFEDSARLAKWPAADRGVVVFADATAVEAKLEAFSDLCARWVDGTTG